MPTDTLLETKTGISVPIKIALLATGFIGAGAIAAAVFVSGDDQSGGGSNEALVSDIQAVATAPRLYNGEVIEFHSGTRGRTLGVYSSPYPGTLTYTDQNAFPDARQLLLRMAGNFKRTNIAIAMNSDSALNVCMTQRNIPVNIPENFTVDHNGNVYTSQGVRLSTWNCEQTAARALTPLQISNTTVNEAFGDLPTDSWIDFRVDFIGHLGTFDPRANTFTAAQVQPIPGTHSPLAIRFWNGNAIQSVTFPARNLTLSYVAQGSTQTEQKTVCLPTTTLTPRTRESIPTEKYYYLGKDGVLYDDPLVITPSATTGCPISPSGGKNQKADLQAP